MDWQGAKQERRKHRNNTKTPGTEEEGLLDDRAGKTAYEALEIMADNDVGGLMVVGEDRKLLGIFTERDYSRKVVLRGRSSKDTAVSELMTLSVYCVSPEDTTEYCMAIMNDKRVRHLPVIEDGKLSGMVSIRDVVNMIVHEKEATIKDLEQYISA